MSPRKQTFLLLEDLATAETGFGLGVATNLLTRRSKLISPVGFDYESEFDTDEDLVTGHPFATESGTKEVGRKMEPVDVEYRADLHPILKHLTSYFGGVNTSGVGPHTHVFIYPGGSALRPKTYSMIVGADRSNEASLRKLDGLYTAGFELAVGSDPRATFKAQVGGDGSFSNVSGLTIPAEAVEGPCFARNALTSIILGPLGTEERKGLVTSLTVKSLGGVDMEPLPTDKITVEDIEYGEEGPAIELELAFRRLDKSGDLQAYREAKTALVFDAMLSAGPDDWLRIQANNVLITKVEDNQYEGARKRQNVTLKLRWVQADLSPFLITASSSDVPVLLA